MQNPYENNLLPLPEELITFIGTQLPLTALKEIARVSKSGYLLFQSNFLINSLLWYVAAGEQDNAQKLLKQYPELLLERGTVTDYSGRTFSNISAWELMRWNGDTLHMGNMLIKSLPEDANGEEIRAHLVDQNKQFDKLGVTYALEGKNYRDTSFNYSPLIKAYKEYIANYDTWTIEQRKTHWCTKVGKEQRYLPAHVVNHYCDPNTPFYPTPTFDERTLKRILSFENYKPDDEELWWSKDTSTNTSTKKLLGINYGAARSDRVGARQMETIWAKDDGAEADLAAVLALEKRRGTIDLASLNSQLDSSRHKMELDSLLSRLRPFVR
jgi:hypothetical protein